MSLPQVVFITGLSGTGKSTLAEYFMQHPLRHWEFTDFDRGKFTVPDNQEEHLEWRRQQTNWWLNEAMDNFDRRGVSTVILGLSLYPQDTFALASAKKLGRENIHFALIHTDPEVRQQRLIDRGTPGHWRGQQPWYDEFYEKLKEVEAPIFDTSTASLKKTADHIVRWLKSLNS